MKQQWDQSALWVMTIHGKHPSVSAFHNDLWKIALPFSNRFLNVPMMTTLLKRTVNSSRVTPMLRHMKEKRQIWSLLCLKCFSYTAVRTNGDFYWNLKMFVLKKDRSNLTCVKSFRRDLYHVSNCAQICNPKSEISIWTQTFHIKWSKLLHSFIL